MSQEIIGKAWIGVGIKDETAPGLQKLEAGLRQRQQRMSGMMRGVAGSGGAGWGAGRGGGGMSGWSQLAFGLEDAVVSAQLNGWQGVMRGMSNNITMAAVAWGGFRAQLLATALVVAGQLAPAFLKWLGYADSVEKVLERMTASTKAFRGALQIRHDASLLGERIQGLSTADAALDRVGALRQRQMQIKNVERPALVGELDFLRQIRVGQFQEMAAENLADRLGEWTANKVAGAQTDEERLAVLNSEISAREQLIRNIDAESNMISNERGEALRRFNALRSNEIAGKAAEEKRAATNSLDSIINAIMGELDPLTGDKGAGALMRHGRERNRQLGDLFDKSGIDGSGLLLELSQLDRMRLPTRGGFNGLPDTLSQFSVEGQRQAAINSRTQDDPAIKHLSELQRLAGKINDRLESIHDELTTN